MVKRPMHNKKNKSQSLGDQGIPDPRAINSQNLEKPNNEPTTRTSTNSQEIKATNTPVELPDIFAITVHEAEFIQDVLSNASIPIKISPQVGAFWARLEEYLTRKGIKLS